MATPQRDDTIEAIKRLDALLECAVMHGGNAALDTEVSQSGEKVNDALKEGRIIKRTIKDIFLDAIKSHPGIKTPELMAASGRGRTAVTDALAVLVSEGMVEYRGSRKTGGYYVKG